MFFLALVLRLLFGFASSVQAVRLGPIEQLPGYAFSLSEGDRAQPAVKMLETILSNVIGFLTIFGGLYFMISFIIGGINWASAGGDDKKIEDAKKRMTNGALGLIIVVSSYSVIYIIGSVLGLDILNLSGSGNTFEKLFGAPPVEYQPPSGDLRPSRDS